MNSLQDVHFTEKGFYVSRDPEIQSLEQWFNKLTPIKIFMWTLTGVALLFAVGRFVVRALIRRKRDTMWVHRKGSFGEDTCYVLALLVLVAGNICIHLIVFTEHRVMDATELTTESQLSQHSGLLFATKFLFWTGIWLNKFVFLLCYRSLFFPKENFMKVWWGVIVLTAIIFLVPITDAYVVCGKLGNLLDDRK